MSERNGQDVNEWEDLRRRITIATHSVSIAELARVTGLNSESVRRYMRHQTPSLQFVQLIAERFDVNANWLLFGRGQMRGTDVSSRVVLDISPGVAEQLGNQLAVVLAQNVAATPRAIESDHLPVRNGHRRNGITHPTSRDAVLE